MRLVTDKIEALGEQLPVLQLQSWLSISRDPGGEVERGVAVRKILPTGLQPSAVVMTSGRELPCSKPYSPPLGRADRDGAG